VLGVGAGGARVGPELALIALLGLALSASLWWAYFGDEQPIERAMRSAALHERPRLAIAFGYTHLALLLGIVLLATGLKHAIPHPLDSLEGFPAVALAVGTALFLAADAAMLRVLDVARGHDRGAGALTALATIPIGLATAAAVQVAALATIVAVTVVAGRRTHPAGAAPRW
jgi:low temperature requirement protein LtrA